jgi:hypothetical protein
MITLVNILIILTNLNGTKGKKMAKNSGLFVGTFITEAGFRYSHQSYFLVCQICAYLVPI